MFFLMYVYIVCMIFAGIFPGKKGGIFSVSRKKGITNVQHCNHWKGLIDRSSAIGPSNMG